ncbi:glucokinase [Nitratireductor sp. StC3]|uniref:glucokinase n=1 Tax=Nitratireductor sp. StC3 TaxID=2126741 RepID=UPI001304ABE0|nr:glucokinase [Nitratireductor sp. StC3]
MTSLVADIGGTKARIAIVEGQFQSEPQVLHCSEFGSLEDALRFAIGNAGVKVDRACIGVAAPVMGDEVNITNNNWTFSVSATKNRLGLDELLAVNDFAALASALPLLDEASLASIGGAQCRASMPQLIIGPGTGLGVATVLFGDTDAPVVLAGEGGYVTLPVHTDRELAVWQVLRSLFGRVSAERVLCGSGLVELYNALGVVDGVDGAQESSSYEIVKHGMADASSREREALDMFLSLLGDVAGNAALTLGARGGVFLNGDLLNELAPLLPGSALHSRFERKGRGRPFLADVGIFLITDRFAALKGCVRMLAGPGGGTRERRDSDAA